jgi:hypothetical protein
VFALHLRETHCDIVQQLGGLSHSWLNNQIIRVKPSCVALWRTDAAKIKVRLDFEKHIKPGGEFDTRIEETRALAHRIIDEFSPRRLVDDGPLAALSSEVRDAIKTVIHREYLEQTDIEQTVKPMAHAIDDLEDALRAFSRTWFQQNPEDSDLIKAFEQLQLKGKSLNEKIANLPEGIVLP